MSKRGSKSGDSPIPKCQKLIGSQKSEDSLSLSGEPDFTFLQESSQGNKLADSEDFSFLGSPSTPASSVSSLPFPPPNSHTSESDSSCPLLSQPENSQSETSSTLVSSQFEYLNNHPFASKSNPTPSLENILIQKITSEGMSSTANTILENRDLKDEIISILCQQSHKSIKENLKKSQLCADKTDRNILLSLTPSSLCQEFKENSPPAFLLLVKGLLGISDPEVVFDSQFLLNNVCLLYSTISKAINRKATAYALLMTTAARDGGLREDSIKLFSMLVHPRTSQKYDKEVLAKGWDKPLKAALETEKEHFSKLHEAFLRKEEMEQVTGEDTGQVEEEINQLVDTVPKQVQQVWDNLNLRTKHRFQRAGDDYAKNNFDWMASIFIKDRI